MGHEKKISFLSHGAKFLFILSLEQWRKIELVQFCCIAPGTNLSVFWVFPSFFPLFLLHKKSKNTMGHRFFQQVCAMAHVALHKHEKNSRVALALKRMDFIYRFA